MSAVPKKKLCWNCEGSVTRDIDNCPYCGVYLHATETENDSAWNPSYDSTKTEEVPSPLYQISSDPSIQEENFNDEFLDAKQTMSFSLIAKLKEDLFPILFLMMGSVFFLFGIILFLFSKNGVLTLQWESDYGFYFLFLAVPLLLLGWRFLQQLDIDDTP